MSWLDLVLCNFCCHPIILSTTRRSKATLSPQPANVFLDLTCVYYLLRPFLNTCRGMEYTWIAITDISYTISIFCTRCTLPPSLHLPNLVHGWWYSRARISLLNHAFTTAKKRKYRITENSQSWLQPRLANQVTEQEHVLLRYWLEQLSWININGQIAEKAIPALSQHFSSLSPSVDLVKELA